MSSIKDILLTYTRFSLIPITGYSTPVGKQVLVAGISIKGG